MRQRLRRFWVAGLICTGVLAGIGGLIPHRVVHQAGVLNPGPRGACC
ncbi:MAG: hypothetical protein JWQ95_6481 [Sphaerisporangium sp.]|nr:hypothetical protein [Sphaerisporangium sp.]